MPLYSKRVLKAVEKGKIPGQIWRDFRDAFEAFEKSRNFRIFEIKKMVDKGPYKYYRLRIGGFRAIFRFDENLIVEDIGPRGSIYEH
jgi:mRNA-degrading endonuclease RelE of RelBE toxin-antitoxin system